MTIYLTSIAARTIKSLLPYLNKNPNEMTVAFIPTAGDLYKEKPWMEEDRESLVKLGFKVEDIDLKNKTSLELKESLQEKDIIFLAGGNTSYLLEQAQKSGFLDVAKEMVTNGTIYIGSSAGSLLAGPSIEVDKIYDDGEFGKVLDSYDGLDFVDFVPLPHANNEKYKSYLKKIVKEYGEKYNLRKLNDNEAILILDGKEILIQV